MTQRFVDTIKRTKSAPDATRTTVRATEAAMPKMHPFLHRRSVSDIVHVCL
jgi:hypothetical protein